MYEGVSKAIPLVSASIENTQRCIDSLIRRKYSCLRLLWSAAQLSEKPFYHWTGQPQRCIGSLRCSLAASLCSFTAQSADVGQRMSTAVPAHNAAVARRHAVHSYVRFKACGSAQASCRPCLGIVEACTQQVRPSITRWTYS